MQWMKFFWRSNIYVSTGFWHKRTVTRRKSSFENAPVYYLVRKRCVTKKVGLKWFFGVWVATWNVEYIGQVESNKTGSFMSDKHFGISSSYKNFILYKYFGISNFLKQPFEGVFIKRCSENMQQIYRRTLFPKNTSGCFWTL